MSSTMVIIFLELLHDLRSITTKSWLKPLAAESQHATVMFRMRVEMPKIRAFVTPLTSGISFVLPIAESTCQLWRGNSVCREMSQFLEGR